MATVSKWEIKLAATEPRPDTQAILDTALDRADAQVHLRFEELLSETYTIPASSRAWEYESWADDLDRVVVALSRQDFCSADHLLSRWLGRFKAPELDEKGLYLFARSTALLGDLKRYQGTPTGLLSAQHSYAGARSVFTQLGNSRRVAQPDDWSVAHQKLALARRGAGDLTTALRFLEIARTSGTPESPMQRVQLTTAQAHILRTDSATRADGLRLLDDAAQIAAQSGLGHQLRSIEAIKRTCEGAFKPPRR